MVVQDLEVSHVVVYYPAAIGQLYCPIGRNRVPGGGGGNQDEQNRQMMGRLMLTFALLFIIMIIIS